MHLQHIHTYIQLYYSKIQWLPATLEKQVIDLQQEFKGGTVSSSEYMKHCEQFFVSIDYDDTLWHSPFKIKLKHFLVLLITLPLTS